MINEKRTRLLIKPLPKSINRTSFIILVVGKPNFVNIMAKNITIDRIK